MSAPKTSRKKAIVVGAGAVGASCAAYLQRDGFDVMMFDPDGMGRGCGEGTVGIFATNIIAPASSEGGVKAMLAAAKSDQLDTLMVNKPHLPDFLPWLASFVSASGPQTFEAGKKVLQEAQGLAVSTVRDIMGGAAFDAHAEERGWMFAYESEEAFQAAQGDRDLRKRHGVVLEELGEADIRALEPDLPAIFKHATLFPREYHTADVRKMVSAIGDVALRGGATLQQRAVDAVQCLSDGSFSVTAGGETFAADVVVIAAGPHSSKFADDLGSPIPHSAERGYGVTFPKAEIKLNRPVTFSKQKMVAAPMAAGLHLISTGEFAPLETAPDYRHTDNLTAAGSSIFAGLNTEGASRWSGWRSTVTDGLPVIGESPRHKGLMYAFGHSHLGLTLAGLSGSLISALATGSKPVMDVAPFRVDRFSLVPKV